MMQAFLETTHLVQSNIIAANMIIIMLIIGQLGQLVVIRLKQLQRGALQFLVVLGQLQRSFGGVSLQETAVATLIRRGSEEASTPPKQRPTR
jgi:hypothetical protein